jgi:hypothetical protein
LKRDWSAIHYGFFQTGKKRQKTHTHTQPHQITSISPYASDKTQRKKSLNRCANEKKKIFSFFFFFSPLAESFDRRLFNYQTTTSFELLPIYSLSPLLVLERLQLVGKYKSPRKKKRKEKKRRGTTAIKSRRWSASETDDNNQVNNITKKEVPL